MLVAGCNGVDPAATAWCDEVPFTSDSDTDLTGKENSFERVVAVKDRHYRAMFDHCGVHSIGVGKMRPGVPWPPTDPYPDPEGQDDDLDYVLEAEAYPDRLQKPVVVYLEGVRTRIEPGPVATTG